MFPCTSCGLCCQNISTVDELKEFDSGNGVCLYFNETDNTCKIYETRPSICRIDEMYQVRYIDFFSKKDFYIENAKVCNQLQLKNKLSSSFNIIIGG